MNEFLGLKVRPDTLDQYIVNDVWNRECYTKHVPIESGDVWLDIGANIGAFSALVLKNNASVIAVEPDQENFKLLRLNAEAATCIRAAVVPGHQRIVAFFLNTHKNKGGHSQFVSRGRERVLVPAVNLNILLTMFHPNKVKMDCEGAEMELLRVMDFSGVAAIAMEFHLAILRDKDKSLYREAIGILENHFKEVIFKDDPKGAWTAMLYGRGKR